MAKIRLWARSTRWCRPVVSAPISAPKAAQTRICVGSLERSRPRSRRMRRACAKLSRGRRSSIRLSFYAGNGENAPMLLLIDNYDSFTYNLVHFLGDLGARCAVHRNDQITVDEAMALKPDAIVLSPGPCTPNEAGICMDLIKAAAKAQVPLLGVCLGHQAIGQVFGGKVVRAPTPMHGKLSGVSHQGRSVFEDVPSPLDATRYHSLIVAREGLPCELEVTAETGEIIMVLRHKTLPIHGVQFHPESIASQHGHKILENFLKIAGEHPTQQKKRAAA